MTIGCLVNMKSPQTLCKELSKNLHSFCSGQNTVLTRAPPAQLFTDLNSGTSDIILSEVNEKTETDSDPSCGDIVISNTTESSNTFGLALNSSLEITCAVGYATGGTLSCDSNEVRYQNTNLCGSV